MSGTGGTCYDFAKGKCTRGSSCRFSHDQSLEERKDAECFDFKRGQCKRGDACRFSHGGESSVQDATENPDYQPFTCTVCEIEINYDYHGRNPPYARSIS
eukprot:1179775-Prorocentrum_minimum.AAC.2